MRLSGWQRLQSKSSVISLGITIEWWLEDANWHRGLRDYWRVESLQGRRLWMFYTPQEPGWFVQGEFA